MPKARAIFVASRRVHFVLFAEDDCRMRRGIGLQGISVAACKVGRRVAWLGYGARACAMRIHTQVDCLA